MRQVAWRYARALSPHGTRRARDQQLGRSVAGPLTPALGGSKAGIAFDEIQEAVVHEVRCRVIHQIVGLRAQRDARGEGVAVLSRPGQNRNRPPWEPAPCFLCLLRR
jgi:hypothetical protein